MNIKKVPVKKELNSTTCECLIAALSERMFDRTLNFGEIADLSEKCGFWEIEKNADKTFARPLTFVVPATQHFASVSRRVE
ncbi:MAG: hypothetical protein JO279_18520 [Verrucomicrobia bacterium]|nr:hypothetical protein [Verrucomicrobiota bacterium]